MSDKTEGGAKGQDGNSTSGVKLNIRKLSFMNPFTTTKSESSTSPTSSSSSKADSPRQKKSLGLRESTGSTSDVEEEPLRELNVMVQYLGKLELRKPGYSDICETVNSTYTRAKPYLKSMDKSTLIFNQDGITIKHEPLRKNSTPHEYLDGSRMSIPETETLYKARRILYCAVDKTHQRVFFFNYQYGSRAENVHMHVIVCKKDRDAKELAKRCSLLFKKIQKDLHKKDKERREDHVNGLQQIRTKSSQSLQSPTSGSKESSCSGTCGSGEWMQERIGLSMA